MRALIVDDEPIARRVLREELETFNDIEIVAELENGESALSLIASDPPDLVFLDLQMPQMNGFEMLTQLKGGRLPVVIIVTAYNEHAIRAFEAGAIDYLLKPVSQARLTQAVERARRLTQHPLEVAEKLAHLQEVATQPRAGNKMRKVVGRLNEEYFLLSTEEVLAFQADGEITWIITAKQRFMATHNLKAMEERLQNTQFRRIHRNALVNVNQIRKLSMLTSQRWLVTLNNGQELIVSKRQARHVRDVLHW